MGNELYIVVLGIIALVAFALWVRSKARLRGRPDVDYTLSLPALPAEPLPMEPGKEGKVRYGGGRDSRHLQLEVAVPQRGMKKAPFLLRIVVHWPTSPLLEIEEQWQSHTRGFRVDWPERVGTIDLIVRVEAPGFDINGQNFKVFPVYVDDDAPELHFVLTPQRTGNLFIIVTVQQYLMTLGSVVLDIAVDKAARGASARPVKSTSAPLRSPSATPLQESWASLWAIMNDAFSVRELRALCHTMRIDLGVPEGTPKSDQIAALMYYYAERDQFSELVAHVMNERPNWRRLVV